LNGSSTCRSRRTAVRRLSAVLLLTCVGALVTRLEARTGERSLSQYMRDRWGIESGFPGGPVYAITQTADGYLWIGAEKGLVRFDGLNFRLFNPGAEFGAGPAVLGVAGAPDGSLWARLRGIALVRFHSGVFQNIVRDVSPQASVVTALLRGRDEAMLLATLDRGAIAYRGGRFAPVTNTKALPSSSFVISMAEASDGGIWLGTRDAGLVRVEGERVIRHTKGLPDLKINCLLPGDAGEVWIGTDRGVARWNGTEIATSGVPAALQRTMALNMTRDRASNIWIAAGSRGLLRLSRNGAVQSSSEAGWNVATVFEDRDGNLWVGSDRGLERWRDPKFTTYSVAQGIPADAVGPLYAEESGRVWFGPSSGGLFWIQDGAVTEAAHAGLAGDVVYSIHGGDGDIWVGRQRGGVTRLRLKGTAIDAEHFTQREGLAQNSVFAIHRSRDGGVWAGTLSGGASLFQGGRFVTYDTRNGLPSNTVASILEASDGTMWFGTPNGLAAFSRGGWRTYATGAGLPSNDVNVLFQDRLDVIWVGTAKGIGIVESGRVRPVGTAAEELRGSILGFAEDRGGSLWINAVDRVLRVDRAALLRDTVRHGDVREYGVADGLLGVESVKRHRIVVADSIGRVWFALTRGLSVAAPARTDHRGLPAVTHVEQMTADGAPLDVHGPIRIPSNRRRLAVTYAGLSLSVPERVRYRYRLDGFDSDWSDPVAERHAIYTNLTPGHYRFRVIASNSDGVWNGAEAALPFEVRAMFWQTAWFQLSAVLLSGVAGWGLYRLRVRQVERRLSARFEERLAERTHIARELHDTLLQGFVSASMQLHVAVDRLPDDSPTKLSVSRVQDLMGKVIDEGRNAVRGLRSPTSTPHELEQAFVGAQQEVGVSNAEYRVIVEGRPRSLKPMVRDEVYRIGREALVNAFRHSGAAHIEIELGYASHELSVFIRDDGRGIDPEVIRAGSEGHWGITGMRERAERIGGHLRIRSHEAAGTEVELRLPGRAAFERNASGWSRTWAAAWLKKSTDASPVERTENRP
jgi:signal transduction histidine kinase/ligand-binding sensor domain-containing protein